jgi:hypothetical protein
MRRAIRASLTKLWSRILFVRFAGKGSNPGVVNWPAERSARPRPLGGGEARRLGWTFTSPGERARLRRTCTNPRNALSVTRTAKQCNARPCPRPRAAPAQGRGRPAGRRALALPKFAARKRDRAAKPPIFRPKGPNQISRSRQAPCNSISHSYFSQLMFILC